MQYQSTRDKTQKVSASRAILQGLSAEGGLFVPEQLPKFSEQHLEKMVSQDYIRRAQKILEEFLSDFSNEEIESCLKGAYDAKKFSGSHRCPNWERTHICWNYGTDRPALLRTWLCSYCPVL